MEFYYKRGPIFTYKEIFPPFEGVNEILTKYCRMVLLATAQSTRRWVSTSDRRQEAGEIKK